MTRRYDDGAFVEREPIRQPIRDEYRDKFFAELGVERLKDPFGFDPDPKSQFGVVQSLMQTAHGLHDDEKTALNMLMSEVGTNVLGVPTLDVAMDGRPTLDGITVKRLSEDFFHRWFGDEAFDLFQSDWS